MGIICVKLILKNCKIWNSVIFLIIGNVTAKMLESNNKYHYSNIAYICVL